MIGHPMNAGKWFACAMIALSVGACVCYAFAGDVRRAIYYGASAALLSTVTF